MGLNHQNLTDTFMVVEPVLSFLLALPYSRIKQIVKFKYLQEGGVFPYLGRSETQIRNGLNRLN